MELEAFEGLAFFVGPVLVDLVLEEVVLVKADLRWALVPKLLRGRYSILVEILVEYLMVVVCLIIIRHKIKL